MSGRPFLIVGQATVPARRVGAVADPTKKIAAPKGPPLPGEVPEES